jgi:hypothetical protein
VSILASVPATFGLAVALLLAAARSARADNGACSELTYTFQPDCYRGADGSCTQTLAHLDFGPQIAVWIETADHTLVDTLMVTSLTATRGIGNRPGIWNFRSGPKFPYGKRWMSLPLWAYGRGKLFDAAFMQDDRETWMGFHEAHSSKEPYFCRPVISSEVNLAVDVVTCPSQAFNSAKGKLEPATKVYYPPRNDLVSFTNQDCDMVGATLPTCTVSAETYAALNDLDAVSAATPPYGQPYARTWHIPPALAGDYAVVVEVNKEYDTNAAHSYGAYEDPALTSYGIDGNFGQPSVLYRVPVHLGGSTPTTAATMKIAGYSKWAGDDPIDGTLLPQDGTIETSTPGSGEMRLLAIEGPSGMGRVHVALQNCGVPGCDAGGTCPTTDAAVPDGAEGPPPHDPCAPLPVPPGEVSGLAVPSTDATSAQVQFLNASATGKTVDSYQIRYRAGATMTDADFASAVPAPFVPPAAPGTPAMVIIPDLKPATQYVLAVRSLDQCQQGSGLAVVAFETTVMKFKQLSGCFVATAAYGSALEPRVAALRRARDRLRPASPLFAAATDLYYRAGPAAAAVVAQSGVARALARRVLGPAAGLAEALDAMPASQMPANQMPADQR